MYEVDIMMMKKLHIQSVRSFEAGDSFVFSSILFLCPQVAGGQPACSTETCWTKQKLTGGLSPQAPCWPMAVSLATLQTDPPPSFAPILELGPVNHHNVSEGRVSTTQTRFPKAK